MVAQSTSITRGNVSDRMSPSLFGVGFLGCGNVKVSINGRTTKAYQSWSNMLERCYLPRRLNEYPTYRDCFVCNEWHNFQTFAAWHKENYIEGYHLDKDIKVDGNKIYSPDTCLFVSPIDNNEKAQSKEYVFTNPKGVSVVIYNLNKFCKDNDLDHGCMSHVYFLRRKQHKGWTK